MGITSFTMIAGTIIYLVLGAGIDAVLPGAGMLGMTVQGFVFSIVCLVAALWLAVRMELFD